MSRTIAVTGVASGIGAALAAALGAAGHRVVGFDRTEASVAVDRFIPLDLGDEGSIAEAAGRAPEGLDGLCANAGIPPRPGLEAAILRVNFLGTRAFTRAMLPRLAPGASIVTMASRAGQGWRENIGQVRRLARLSGMAEAEGFVDSEGIDATRCYNLSKEAVIAWTVGASEAMTARGLRVNAISPGAVETPILDDFGRAFGERMARNVARAGRPGTPGEVAAVAAFLLSPESGWIRGADIAVDGGMGAFALADALELGVPE